MNPNKKPKRLENSQLFQKKNLAKLRRRSQNQKIVKRQEKDLRLIFKTYLISEEKKKFSGLPIKIIKWEVSQ